VKIRVEKRRQQRRVQLSKLKNRANLYLVYGVFEPFEHGGNQCVSHYYATCRCRPHNPAAVHVQETEDVCVRE
jgi:hypothetical protein